MPVTIDGDRPERVADEVDVRGPEVEVLAAAAEDGGRPDQVDQRGRCVATTISQPPGTSGGSEKRLRGADEAR